MLDLLFVDKWKVLQVHLPEWQPRERGAREASRERGREGRLKLKCEFSNNKYWQLVRQVNLSRLVKREV